MGSFCVELIILKKCNQAKLQRGDFALETLLCSLSISDRSSCLSLQNEPNTLLMRH